MPEEATKDDKATGGDGKRAEGAEGQMGKDTSRDKDKRYSIGTRNRAYWLAISPLAAKRANVQTFAAWVRQRVDREALDAAR